MRRAESSQSYIRRRRSTSRTRTRNPSPAHRDATDYIRRDSQSFQTILSSVEYLAKRERQRAQHEILVQQEEGKESDPQERNLDNLPDEICCRFCKTSNTKRRLVCINPQCAQKVTGEALRCGLCVMPVAKEDIAKYCWMCYSEYSVVGLIEYRPLVIAEQQNNVNNQNVNNQVEGAGN